MKLLIISHTEHYLVGQTIMGWNPTIREIDQLATLFETVTHLAPLHQLEAPPSAVAYTASNIYFKPLAPSGGQGVYNKLKILWYVIPNLIKINRECQKADFIHFRAPTNLGVYTLPFLWFYRHKKQWIKYAGNWVQQNKPWSYQFQKWWMVQNFNQGVVSINGAWHNQPAHIKTFENPCLTEEQIQIGLKVARAKVFSAPFRFVFVGRLEDEKGVGRIIDSLRKMDLDLIASIDFVGDGQKKKDYQSQSEFLGGKVRFHGFLGNSDVHKLYAKSHFFLLPTIASEGFPKVIAEAACYGSIPIVSNVSSISHYITDEVNGFLWDAEGSTEFYEVFAKSLDSDSVILEKIANKSPEFAIKFSFVSYLNKVSKYLLDGRSMSKPNN